MSDALLSADIAAVAELMRHCALQGRDMTPEGLNFVVGALDQLAVEARTLEDGLRRATCHLAAADARVEALATPDLVAQVQRDLAIAEGKRAGQVIDLRPFFERERPERASGRSGPERAPENSAAVSRGGKEPGDAA